MPHSSLMYTIADVCRLTRIGRTKVYEELTAGRLRSVRVGRRQLVTAEALDAYVALLTSEADRRRPDEAVAFDIGDRAAGS